MKFLSLFSGIEACSVAWKSLGWECVGFSEIEPFPCTVLQHHYPSVPNLGDVTKITEQQIADLGEFDVLVFGSPCQDLSTAGTRMGFQDGTRSNLFYAALRIFDYARKHNNCRFALWENVPGAFSSNKGADFTAVVREMAGLKDIATPANGWGNTGAALGENGLLEWRVLDAQYFGLAQRRKRVFASLDTGDWFNRPPILFERESVRGDTPPSRTQRGETTATPNTSPTTSSGQVLAFQSSYNNVSVKDDITPPILAAQGATGNKGVYVCHGSQHPISNTDELANCLGRNNGMENTIAYTIHADPTPKISERVSGTLRSQGGGGVVPPSVVYGFQPRLYSSIREATPTLCATDYKDPMCVGTPLGVIAGNIIGRDNTNGGNQVGIYESETSPTLTTADRHAVIHNYVVRRLTPTECERLMGFPDGYTDVPNNGKPASNSARYKALGNSMAVPVMQWIGKQIQQAVGEPMKMMTLSPTSIDTFLTCPYQYKAKYITKEVKFESNAHAEFGSAVHENIEFYLLGKDNLSPMLEPLRPTLDKIKSALVSAEMKLATTKWNTPCDFFHDDAYMRCIVDAVASSPDKSTIVAFDWKTGKKRDSATQSDVIAKCIFNRYPECKKVITVFAYFMVDDITVKEYKKNSSFIDLENKIAKIEAAHKANEFPYNPNGLCKKWCDVVSCPHNGRK